MDKAAVEHSNEALISVDTVSRYNKRHTGFALNLAKQTNPHTFSTNYPASGSESSPPESSPPEFSPPESSPAEASASESSSHTEESAPPLN